MTGEERTEAAEGAAPYATPTDRDPTPDLDAFHAAYEQDDNEWWMIACGHHQNLYEAAMDRLADLRQRLLTMADEWDKWQATGYPSYPEAGAYVDGLENGHERCADKLREALGVDA